jgi:hypothetical protein
VAGPSVVLRARRLAWSRELALTSLVARLRVPVWETALVPRAPAPAASFLIPGQGDRHDPSQAEEWTGPVYARAVAHGQSPCGRHRRTRVHAALHWVAVPPDHVPPRKDVDAGSAGAENLPAHVRKFGACTADLELLGDWLYSNAASPASPWNRPAFTGFHCSSCLNGAASRFIWSIHAKPSTPLAGPRAMCAIASGFNGYTATVC